MLLVFVKVWVAPVPNNAKLPAVMPAVCDTVPVELRVRVLATAFNAPPIAIPPVVLSSVKLSLVVNAPVVIAPVPSLRPTVMLEKPSTKWVLKLAAVSAKVPAAPAMPMVVPVEVGLIVSAPLVCSVPLTMMVSAIRSIALLELVIVVAAFCPTVPATTTPELLVVPAPVPESVILPLLARTLPPLDTVTPALLAPVPLSVMPPPLVARIDVLFQVKTPKPFVDPALVELPSIRMALVVALLDWMVVVPVWLISIPLLDPRPRATP